MALIEVYQHFTDTLGNQYNILMKDHTQGPQKEVLDGLCSFIFNSPINGPGVIWTGWLDVTSYISKKTPMKNFVYWVDPSSPLCAFQDAELVNQHPNNFLAFTQIGNQITITNFGPFGWNKSWDLDKVRATRKHAEDWAKDAETERKRVEEDKRICEKGDPPQSKEEPKKRPLTPGWKPTKIDKTIAEMEDKMIKQVVQLVETQAAIEIAVHAQEEMVEAIAKATAEASVEAGAEAVPVVGFFAGLVFGVWRLAHGDFAGAGWELAAGSASLVPGPGTVASLGIKAAHLGKDIFETQKKVKEEEAKQKALYDEKLKEWKADNDTMIRLLGEKIKEYKDAEDGCNHCAQCCDQLIKLAEEAGAGEGAKE